MLLSSYPQEYQATTQPTKSLFIKLSHLSKTHIFKNFNLKRPFIFHYKILNLTIFVHLHHCSFLLNQIRSAKLNFMLSDI